MNEIEKINLVKEFNKKFGTENQTIEQKKKYFEEELLEYWNGVQLCIHSKEKDNPEKALQKGYKEILDALIDMKYVLFGIMIKEDIEPITITNYIDNSIVNCDKYEDKRESFEFIEVYMEIDNYIQVNNILNYLLAEHGLLKHYDAAFIEVHNSNMSKLDVNGNVLRGENNKILKSVTYFKPNLYKILGY